jgi:hypothetical protein
MTPSVVAAFADRPAAEAALERLRRSGLATGDIRLHATKAPVTNAGSIRLDEVASGGLFSNGLSLLDQLFGTRTDERHAADYEDLVRREATLVSVQVDTTDTAKQVCELLGAEGATRVSTLPQPGLAS